MKTRKTVPPAGNLKKQKKAGPLIAALAFFVLCGGAMIFYAVKTGNGRGLIIREPAGYIALPRGITVNNPRGYTVFKSKLYGVPVYSFVKYAAAWGNNAFFKIDMTVMKVKDLAPGGLKVPAETKELNAFVAAKKIFFREKNGQELQKDKEEYASYETDYRAFLPGKTAAYRVNERQWNSYYLVKYEDSEGKKLIKEWRNIYFIYKEYIIIIDYIVNAGFTRDKMKKPEMFDAVTGEIEADVRAVIEGITFK